jgi:hypothetical protein
VHTVTELGWSGTRNGPLLALAAPQFDVFVTADQNLEHQQNRRILPLAVVVLVARTNRLDALLPLVPALLEALPKLAVGDLIRIGSR